jgi:hypothetical protein
LPANACWLLVDLTIHKNQIKYAKESSREKAFTPERLMELGFAYAAPLVSGSAVHNKVFDSLESGPKTAGQLAIETGASERGLRIIMNALIEQQTGDARRIFRDIAPHLISRWLRLTDVVRTAPGP